MPAVFSRLAAAGFSLARFKFSGQGCFHLFLLLAACVAKAQKNLKQQPNATDSQVSGQATFSTKVLTKADVHFRLLEYGAIIGFFVMTLFVAGAVVAFKKGGQFILGPLVVRKGGVFWKEQLLCCGPKVSKPTYSAPEPTDTEDGAKDAIIEPVEVQHKAADPEQKPLLDMDSEAVKKKFHDWELKRMAQHNRFLKLRFGMLVGLFIAYVSVSIGIPLMSAGTVSCGNGFFWESHMIFLAVFCLTKFAELYLYSTDPTLTGQLDVFTFLLKFSTSFLGYIDGYSDSTSIVIARSCPSSFAQALSWYMLWTYIGGVVILQWGVVFFLATKDPSNACLMKVIHMDALASCVSLPDDQKRLWDFLHMARTFGEDIPQAVLQSLFVVKVKENYVLIVSIIIGVASSCKALWDAFSRALQAAGAYEAFAAEAEVDEDEPSPGTYRIISERSAVLGGSVAPVSGATPDEDTEWTLVPAAATEGAERTAEPGRKPNRWQLRHPNGSGLSFHWTGERAALYPYVDGENSARPQTWELRPGPAGGGWLFLVSWWDEGGSGYHGNGKALNDEPTLVEIGSATQSQWKLHPSASASSESEEDLPPEWVADLEANNLDVKEGRWGDFTMANDPDKGRVLTLVTKYSSANVWTETTLPVPAQVGRVATNVSASLKITRFQGNCAYLNIIMANLDTREEGKLNVKFDENRLRSYGPVIGREDFGVACSTVQLNKWFDLNVLINREQRTIDYVVDGIIIRSAAISPGYTLISGINLAGFAKGLTFWWADVKVSTRRVSVMLPQ